MITQNKYRVVFASVLVVLLIILLISACDAIGIGGTSEPPPPSGPAKLGILTLANNTKVLVDCPVQIQSAHQGNISRVELSVQAQGEEGATLLRADAPNNGVVLQEWIPDRPGPYTVNVVAYADGSAQNPHTIQVEVMDSIAVSCPSVQATVTPISPPPVIPAGFEPPTAVVVVAENPTPTPTPTPTLIPTPIPTVFYPPPPPAPGVPPGPTQKQLPEFMPPVCDAAKLIDVFEPDTRNRVAIDELDDVPAKTVGGATVFRAWRLQNTGTCTWGPGYELVFYGGRSMGSGGVAFESTWPGEPGRRNIIIDRNRLVVPKGFPNQVAVVEVMLNAPVTPGVHQSYWRMRNPHGVYFGPILGVTLEVVRECKFGIYGAPVINRFDILGVGNVFRPVDPMHVQAERGQTVTLDWDIINSTNLDVVLASPTGNIDTISSGDPTDRATIRPTELGQYTITLYADNGPCTVSAQVFVDVVPGQDEQDAFILAVDTTDSGLFREIGASDTGKVTINVAEADPIRMLQSLSTRQTQIRWRHLDKDTDKFVLVAQRYERTSRQVCNYTCTAFDLEVPCFSWTPGITKQECNPEWGEWTPSSEANGNLPSEMIVVSGQGLRDEVTRIPPVKIYPPNQTNIAAWPPDAIIVGNDQVRQGSRISAVRTVGLSGNAQGVATIKNIDWGLCPDPATYNADETGYAIRYQMRAEKDGNDASPKFSNPVDILCSGSFNASPEDPGLSAARSGSEFNPKP